MKDEKYGIAKDEEQNGGTVQIDQLDDRRERAMGTLFGKEKCLGKAK